MVAAARVPEVKSSWGKARRKITNPGSQSFPCEKKTLKNYTMEPATLHARKHTFSLCQGTSQLAIIGAH